MNRFVRKRVFVAKAGARGGKRNGVYYRSTWEFNVSLWLDELKRRGDIVSWDYEKVEFEFKTIKRGTRFYKPDFRVTEVNCVYFIEVKGFLAAKDITVLSRMARHYPDVTVLLMDKARYAAIESEFSGLEGWES